MEATAARAAPGADMSCLTGDAFAPRRRAMDSAGDIDASRPIEARVAMNESSGVDASATTETSVAADAPDVDAPIVIDAPGVPARFGALAAASFPVSAIAHGDDVSPVATCATWRGIGHDAGATSSGAPCSTKS